MKRTILILLFAVTASIAFGQGRLSVGRAQLNAGVGFSTWGLPIYAGLDYGIHKDITLGGEVSFRSYRESWHNDKYNHSVFSFSGNCNYHFNSIMNIPNRWDFYAGLNIGFIYWNSPSGYGGDHSSGLGLGAQVGGRYYLNNRLGLNLEIAGGNVLSGGKFGITYKF